MVRYKDAQWQADLVDMRGFAAVNKNTNYILTVIDLCSKYAWSAPIKKKTGSEITKAFQKIFNERMPEKLQTDKGTEFINKETQALLKNKGIHWFVTETETKAVERFNRTLKDRMFRYEPVVWDNLYGDVESKERPKLKVGDEVRIFKLRGRFKRGYTANYTDEIFIINEVLPTNPPTYKIIDKQGEEVIGAFYKEELSKYNQGHI